MVHNNKQVTLFKALMHPARLEILEVLRSGEECVCHMEAVLGYRQAYISQHLSVLKEAGIIEDHRDGWNVFYRVISPQIYDLLNAAVQISGERVPTPSHKRHSQKDCPCPKCSLVVETTKA